MSLQVAQLRLENTTILKRVTEVTLKFQEAAIENRVLKADVVTLQAKVIFYCGYESKVVLLELLFGE